LCFIGLTFIACRAYAQFCSVCAVMEGFKRWNR
jgi:hypothetical protein